MEEICERLRIEFGLCSFSPTQLRHKLLTIDTCEGEAGVAPAEPSVSRFDTSAEGGVHSEREALVLLLDDGMRRARQVDESWTIVLQQFPLDTPHAESLADRYGQPDCVFWLECGEATASARCSGREPAELEAERAVFVEAHAPLVGHFERLGLLQKVSTDVQNLAYMEMRRRWYNKMPGWFFLSPLNFEPSQVPSHLTRPA